MLVVVAYDVRTETPQGAKRLRRVAAVCKNYGVRVQYSVFECLLEPAQWISLKHKLLKEIDQDEDSLRFYFLGKNWRSRLEHVGVKKSYDQEEPLVI